MTAHRQHPRYSDGYFDALDGAPLPADTCEPYREGHAAGERARATFSRNGMVQIAPGEFSIALPMIGCGR